MGRLEQLSLRFYDADCWREDQIKHNEFLSDLNLLNKFIKIQTEENPDFQIEIFIEPSTTNIVDLANDPKGTVNLIISKSRDDAGKKNHTVSDVLSLNTSMVMTGFCLANNEARPNTNFYNDIAISNLMGAWGFMDVAIDQLWWAMPTDWDSLSVKTKKLYVDNYIQHQNNEEYNE